MDPARGAVIVPLRQEAAGTGASSLRLEMSTHLARLRDLLTARGDVAADLTAAVSVPYLSVAAAASQAIGERIHCRPQPGGQWGFSFGWATPTGGTGDMDAVATTVRTVLLAAFRRVSQ